MDDRLETGDWRLETGDSSPAISQPDGHTRQCRDSARPLRRACREVSRLPSPVSRLKTACQPSERYNSPMYATCLFCNGALGRNESIEHFPVGRRLAFDAAKGRLWVVCPRCARWNLTPLDARWEAIEEAERAYRDSKLRVATDNVGLA